MYAFSRCCARTCEPIIYEARGRRRNTERFRATATGVPVDIIVSGEYPSDAKPKPVVFPDPRDASEEIDGIQVITLRQLIQLKLASGLSAPHRLKCVVVPILPTSWVFV
jgi:hypothetical protein